MNSIRLAARTARGADRAGVSPAPRSSMLSGAERKRRIDRCARNSSVRGASGPDQTTEAASEPTTERTPDPTPPSAEGAHAAGARRGQLSAGLMPPSASGQTNAAAERLQQRERSVAR